MQMHRKGRLKYKTVISRHEIRIDDKGPSLDPICYMVCLKRSAVNPKTKPVRLIIIQGPPMKDVKAVIMLVVPRVMIAFCLTC